ncbi:hypothetical protein GCM10009551_008400 [Nocardiopsis tropica]
MALWGTHGASFRCGGAVSHRSHLEPRTPRATRLPPDSPARPTPGADASPAADRPTRPAPPATAPGPLTRVPVNAIRLTSGGAAAPRTGPAPLRRRARGPESEGAIPCPAGDEDLTWGYDGL